MSLPAKASLWFAVTNMLQKGMSVLTAPVFTRILTAQEYGVVSLYFSWESIITIVATLYLSNGGGLYNGMRRYQDDRDGYISSILVFVSVLTLGAFLIYLFAQQLQPDMIGLSLPIMTMMFLDVFFTSAMTLWSVRNKYEYKYKNVIFFTLLNIVLGPTVSLLFVSMTSRYRAEARLAGMVFVKIIIYGYLYGKIISRGKTYYRGEYWKFSFCFNFPLLPHYLSQTILNQSDRIMISKICGTDYAGIYGVAYNASMLMKIATSAVNSSLVPWTYRLMEKKKCKRLSKVAVLIEAMVGCGCLFMALMAPDIIRLLAPQDYYAAVWIVPPVSSSVLLMVLYGFFVNIEFFFEKKHAIMTASLIAAALNIFLNAVFIPAYGFIAAGYTTLFCYFFYAVFHYALMVRICKLENICNPYNGKLLWTIAVVVILLSLLCSLLYHATVLRYVCAAVLVMVISAESLMLKKNRGD